MKIEDLALDEKAAGRLEDIDSLVHQGLSRERASRIIDRLRDLVDGPWADLLGSLVSADPGPETALIQALWVAYVANWVKERAFFAEIQQIAAMSQLARLDNQNTSEEG